MSDQRILIAEDNENFRRLLLFQLKHLGHTVFTATDGIEALEKAEAESPALVIADLNMPRMGAIEMIRRLKEKRPDIPIIVITAYGTVDSAVEAMKIGAVDYIQKPFEEERIKLAIGKALELRKILTENLVLRREVRRMYDFGNIIAASAGMKKALELAEQVAPSNSTALIIGESGTGKELLARAIHLNSQRSRGPFVALNCAALPDNLLESELFGYEKGAFTGATDRKRGRFELADGGTLLLDEIGRMPLALQAKILRLVQEKEFERLGGEQTLRADVRFLVATNMDLKALIKEGKFLEDLYYRISVFPITIPPLRERPEDILPLTRSFLSRFCAEMGKPVPRIPPETEQALRSHPWLGNVRELQNYIERAVILLRGDTLTLDLLPEIAQEPRRERAESDAPLFRLPDSGISLEELERSLLVQALERTGGNKTAAAKALGLTRATLRYRMEKYGLLSPGTEPEENAG
ncbi:MAG: sigma-54 dependent transcriptional regulator [Candidatus Sumerlaeia bacterium]|nr:sigma-54 dependent transcriptional regulator [Candidatus Sumerlaeia bacterium]